MSDLREQIIQEYIESNYPNSKVVDFTSPESGLTFYTADQLQDIDADWFPLSCHRDPETGKAVYGGMSKIVHTYTEGETGAGKTTRFVIQSIRGLSSMKVKPSFVVVDIHGEIIENLYPHLKSNGYKVRILNCDDPQRSDTYNPFAELAEECYKNKAISNDAINKIRRVAEIMQPVESHQDPIWDMGARSYTNGCILDKFEDLIAGKLPIECMTIYNIIQHHHWIRSQLVDFDSQALFKIKHYQEKGPKALSVQKMVSVTNNAEKTRGSYFGVIENHFDSFGQPSLYSLSSSNTIDISDFIDEPTVIVIQSGNTKIGDDLISLLMNEIYTAVVKVGKANARKKLPRKIHCFLDEFANCNIADGPEYVRMLTTSRKFGMYWHMILQCDAQLDRKYDAKIGRIIRANSTEIFMGSHDYETSVRFAKSCGQKTIESLGTTLSRQIPALNVVDLMTTERLNLTEEGYAYIRLNKRPLLKSYIEAFYNCEEFIPVDSIDKIYPVNEFDYTATAFCPDDIPPHMSKKEYELLIRLGDGVLTVDQIRKMTAPENPDELLKGLARIKAISILDDHRTKVALSQGQLKMLGMWYREGTIDPPAEKKIEVKLRPKRRNPFDFDFDDDEVDEDDIDNWLDTEPEEEEMFITADQLLLGHIRANKTKIRADVIDTSTMIPESLARLFNLIYSDENMLDENEDYHVNVKVLRFEIIEAYIKKNNFTTKTRWVAGMKNEMRKVVWANLFPEEILAAFRQAVSELENELTLGNIKEIKKIITEGDDW